MWHIYCNKRGLFEFAYISKGRYIAGTRQGYERKKAALKALAKLGNTKETRVTVQDDTEELKLSKVYSLHNEGNWSFLGVTKTKAYKP